MNLWFILILSRFWSLCFFSLRQLLLLPPENKKTLCFYREVMLFNLILLMPRTKSFMNWLSILLRVELWELMCFDGSPARSQMNNASFTLPRPDFVLSARLLLGGLQWIIHQRLHHNIYTGIDASLLFSDVSLCAVQCVKIRWLMGIYGMADQKRVVTQSILLLH